MRRWAAVLMCVGCSGAPRGSGAVRAAPPSAGPPPALLSSQPVKAQAVAATPWPALRTAGLAIAGGGIGLGVLGVILTFLEGSQASILREHCHSESGIRHCDAVGTGATDSAFALMHGSRLALAFGGVAIVGGVCMFFLTSDPPPAKGSGGAAARIQVAPVMGPQAGGLTIQGWF